MMQAGKWVFKATLARFYVVVLILMLPVAAAAQAPWQWQMSLKVDRAGDSMYMPSAVGFDAESERYYAVDTGRNRLVSFDREGKLISVFTANEQLRSPFDMVRLDSGQLWVVEKGRNSLTLIDLAARKIEPQILMDGDRRIFPDRIANADNRLYVLDRSSGDVLRLDTNLDVDQRFGCGDCNAGLTDFVVRDDQVAALAARDRKIIYFNNDGSIDQEYDLGEEVEFPVSLAIGPSGFIYVLDRHQNNILAYDEQGVFRYRFLDEGQSAGRVYFARHLRFDPWGNLCVVDEGNGRVEIFSR